MKVFRSLMDSLQVRHKILPNRIVFPATITNYALEKGAVSEPLLEYYEKKAQNRIGLTIVGATTISSDGKLSHTVPALIWTTIWRGFLVYLKS